MLTFCPPGPDERTKSKRISEDLIVMSAFISSILFSVTLYTPQPFAIRFLKDRLPLLIEGNLSDYFLIVNHPTLTAFPLLWKKGKTTPSNEHRVQPLVTQSVSPPEKGGEEILQPAQYHLNLLKLLLSSFRVTRR